MSKKRLLVTGGAGFMGSAFIRFGLERALCEKLINLDLLTYAADLKNLEPVENDPRYSFIHGDIRDQALVEKLCKSEKIDTIVHFAAETHVDRSIESPTAFLETNVKGTFALLEVVRKLPKIHFHQISTDEVFGSLPHTGFFEESSQYKPNSPYAASKAASDHFVRSFAHTFDLSFTLSHSSNNFGPCQNPEKFIPRMISCCLQKEALPIYGSGENVRDWLYVEDHAEAVWTILQKGKKGESYNVGGNSERKNLEILELLIQEIALQCDEEEEVFRRLIAFVKDRPGHDFRYALSTRKIEKELGWKPRHDLKRALKKTVSWYLSRSLQSV
jgi:dTDP-glucose 4,6-dehydratase